MPFTHRRGRAEVEVEPVHDAHEARRLSMPGPFVSLAIWHIESEDARHQAKRAHTMPLDPHEARALAYALLNAADAARFNEKRTEQEITE